MWIFQPFLFFLFFAASVFCIQLDVNILAPKAILINAENNAVLYEKNAREKAFPASITKVATALYILDKKKTLLDEYITISAETIKTVSPEEKERISYPAYILESDGSSLGLVAGEFIPAKTLFYGMMLVSGNDAANVLAEAASNSVPQFMKELNIYLQSLGCVDTHFSNPHGLHHPDHYTTASEIALITKKALSLPQFRQIVSTISCSTCNTNMRRAVEMKQTNQLLLQESNYYYPYAIGVKTGYHSKGGYNLVAAAKFKGRTLIAVVLGEEKNKDRYTDMIKLFNAAFAENKEKRVIFKEGEVFKAQIEGANSPLEAYLKNEVTYQYYPSEEVPIKVVIKWNDLVLPIQQEGILGEIQVVSINSGEVLESSFLFAKKGVKRTFYKTFKDILSGLQKLVSSR